MSLKLNFLELGGRYWAFSCSAVNMYLRGAREPGLPAELRASDALLEVNQGHVDERFFSFEKWTLV